MKALTRLFRELNIKRSTPRVGYRDVDEIIDKMRLLSVSREPKPDGIKLAYADIRRAGVAKAAIRRGAVIDMAKDRMGAAVDTGGRRTWGPVPGRGRKLPSAARISAWNTAFKANTKSAARDRP